LGSSPTITDTGTTPSASAGGSSVPFPRVNIVHLLSRRQGSDGSIDRTSMPVDPAAALGWQALQSAASAWAWRRAGAAADAAVRRADGAGTDGPCINKCAGTWAGARGGASRAHVLCRARLVAASSSALCLHHWGRTFRDPGRACGQKRTRPRGPTASPRR